MGRRACGQRAANTPALQPPRALQPTPTNPSFALQAAGDDPDLVLDSAVVSLRCPLTGGRLSSPPARHARSAGLVGFSLDAFLASALRTRKWVCPHSLRPAPPREVGVDAYLAAVLEGLKARAAGGGGDRGSGGG